MGSKKDLTEGQQGAIIYGYKRGDSLRTIAAAVGCCKSSVGNIIEEYKRQSICQKERPGNLNELDALVKKSWKDTPPELCRRLADSMINR
ncbi:12922_t:CDS:2, partial [Dentiscutata heterogama]